MGKWGGSRICGVNELRMVQKEIFIKCPFFYFFYFFDEQNTWFKYSYIVILNIYSIKYSRKIGFSDWIELEISKSFSQSENLRGLKYSIGLSI